MALARPLLGEKSSLLHPIHPLSMLPLLSHPTSMLCLLCRVWSVLVNLNEIIGSICSLRQAQRQCAGFGQRKPIVDIGFSYLQVFGVYYTSLVHLDFPPLPIDHFVLDIYSYCSSL